MVRRSRRMLLMAAMALLLIPGSAFAQVGNISGVVRDSQGAAMPGVTVEATSPALIEKVRATVTDDSGRYQIIALPVGTYTVAFTLAGFNRVERDNIATSSDFTTTVSVDMKPGDVKEVITVSARASTVDVQNARQLQVFTGEELRELPTSRNLSDLINLVPGIAIDAADAVNSVPTICSGG